MSCISAIPLTCQVDEHAKQRSALGTELRSMKAAQDDVAAKGDESLLTLLPTWKPPQALEIPKVSKMFATAALVFIFVEFIIFHRNDWLNRRWACNCTRLLKAACLVHGLMQLQKWVNGQRLRQCRTYSNRESRIQS